VTSPDGRLVVSSLPLPQDPCTGVAAGSRAPSMARSCPAGPAGAGTGTATGRGEARGPAAIRRGATGPGAPCAENTTTVSQPVPSSAGAPGPATAPGTAPLSGA